MTGELTAKMPEQVYLLVQGIEWDISVSANTLMQLGSLGSEVKLYLYLQHSEDQMRLYGFYSLQERAAFLELIKVSGIGPKGAQKILSGLTPGQLNAALESGDAGLLSHAPGVGLKTAQKIILALKGKLILEQELAPSGVLSDLVASLVQMGFERKLVEKALAEVEKFEGMNVLHGDEKEKELFQKALVWLSTR